MKLVLIMIAALLAFNSVAEAKHRHHHKAKVPGFAVLIHHHKHHFKHHVRYQIEALTQRYEHVPPEFATQRPVDCYGIPWCGCYMRHITGIMDKSLNLARNWLNVGMQLAGPAPGAIGIMPHHVFKVLAVVASNRVLAISGNDGHAVKTRVRSTSNVIGWRML